MIEFTEFNTVHESITGEDGSWSIDFASASDKDGVKLHVEFPDQKLIFIVSRKVGSNYEFRSVSNKYMISPEDNLQLCKLTLTRPAGKGLCLHGRKDSYGGHDVLWADLCAAKDAITV